MDYTRTTGLLLHDRNKKMGFALIWIPLNFESDLDQHLDTKILNKDTDFPVCLLLSHFFLKSHTCLCGGMHSLSALVSCVEYQFKHKILIITQQVIVDGRSLPPPRRLCFRLGLSVCLFVCL